MRTCDICQRKVENLLGMNPSNLCSRCTGAIVGFALYVETIPDLNWAVLKAAIIARLAEHEQEIRQGLERRIAEAHHEAENLRAKLEALEKQDPKCAL